MNCGGSVGVIRGARCERATGRAEPREIAYASGRRSGRGKSVMERERERAKDSSPLQSANLSNVFVQL